VSLLSLRKETPVEQLRERLLQLSLPRGLCIKAGIAGGLQGWGAGCLPQIHHSKKCRKANTKDQSCQVPQGLMAPATTLPGGDRLVFALAVSNAPRLTSFLTDGVAHKKSRNFTRGCAAQLHAPAGAGEAVTSRRAYSTESHRSRTRLEVFVTSVGHRVWKAENKWCLKRVCRSFLVLGGRLPHAPMRQRCQAPLPAMAGHHQKGSSLITSQDGPQ